MLKVAVLIGAVMIASLTEAYRIPEVEFENEYVDSEAAPVTIAVQFNNNVKQGATIVSPTADKGSYWGEDLDEEVTSNGGFSQGQLVGGSTSAGGSFGVQYLSGEIFTVSMSIGGPSPGCFVVRKEGSPTRIAMKAKGKITGRLLTCTINASDSTIPAFVIFH